MPIIERFTPGGNFYPDGSSTFAVLREIFEKIAKVRDTVDAKIVAQLTNLATAEATTKADAAQRNAINTASSDATTKAEAAQEAAISTASADATTKATAARDDATATAQAYTDASFAAAAPGGATDASVDAAIDRAILAQRIGSVTLTQVAPGVYELTTV